MARNATDADFNSSGRYLDLKIDIYFDGLSELPFSVTRDTYIIDVNWLEEGSADSSSLFGDVSSNELSFRLYNENGMFSPTNASGQFFGKIKAGIPLILSIRPEHPKDDTVNWEQLGVYYVGGWDAQVTGTYADVVANDSWQTIFGRSLPTYPIALNKVWKDFLTEVFAVSGATVLVDNLLSETLPYAFVEDSLKEFLKEAVAASLAYITSDKQGNPMIGAYTASRALRATLTDDNQVKSAVIKQSITRAYDGVALTYVVPQIAAVEPLVEMTGITVSPGQMNYSNIAFSKTPLWNVSLIKTASPSDTVNLVDYVATQSLISILVNSETETSFDLTVYGRVLNLIEVLLTDDATKLLTINNKYIQDTTYALFYKNVMKAFIDNAVSVLTVSIRGNPLLNIGDKVVIQSTKYNLDFTGIIQRMSYAYDGGLSCELKLLNVDILQGVRV